MSSLCRAVLAGCHADRTDGQLLKDYLTRRDEAAVAALVKRHGPMVWGVCRRLLAHHDAEDAFQAAFLVLVRKAASIVPREMVGHWLYGVARQTALKARATAARRRARERQVQVLPEPATVPGPDLGRDVEALLDQELSRLPDKYRVAIVLCDLGGKTRKEAARQLRIPEGTLSTRLRTARTMLAKRLSRHGLAVSAGALAAAVSRQATANVPASVAFVTIKAASRHAAGQAATGAVSANVAALTEGVLKTMLLSRFKKAAVALLVAFVIMAGAGVTLSRTPAGEQPEKGEAVQKGDKRPPTSDRAEARVKMRWEYRALPHEEIAALAFNKRGTDTVEIGLNLLGDEGWNLIAIEPSERVPGGYRPALYVFKRPKP